MTAGTGNRAAARRPRRVVPLMHRRRLPVVALRTDCPGPARCMAASNAFAALGRACSHGSLLGSAAGLWSGDHPPTSHTASTLNRGCTAPMPESPTGLGPASARRHARQPLAQRPAPGGEERELARLAEKGRQRPWQTPTRLGAPGVLGDEPWRSLSNAMRQVHARFRAPMACSTLHSAAAAVLATCYKPSRPSPATRPTSGALAMFPGSRLRLGLLRFQPPCCGVCYTPRRGLVCPHSDVPATTETGASLHPPGTLPPMLGQPSPRRMGSGDMPAPCCGAP